MNYNIDVRNISYPSELGLSVVQCGMMSCHNECVSVPHVYEKYILTFVIKGNGTYIIDGVPNYVTQGQGFLTAPNVITSWETAKENPWEYIFITLDGNDVKRMLRNVGLGSKSKIFNFEYDTEIIENLKKIFELSNDSKYHTYNIMSHFYSILNRFSIIYKADIQKRENINSYYENAITYIENNYMYNISISDISKHLNIDRTYLYKIFMNQDGVSPLKFLTSYRLEKARQMMGHDDIATSTIALSVGFYDYSHFSHRFLKEYGITPGKYRKNLLRTNPTKEGI